MRNAGIVRGPITIENGSFDYSKTRDVNEFTVRSAIVSLPVGESGTIDSIKVISTLEYTCFSNYSPLFKGG